MLAESLARRFRARFAAALFVPLALAACELGPGEEGGYPKVTQRTQPQLPRAAAPDPPPVVAADLPPGVTQELVDQGQEIYATSVCVACHGVAGSGSVIAPALNDADWLHADGSLESIVEIIRSGVTQPRQFPAQMPPMGGASFTDEQLRALGAYVYAISRAGGA